MLARQKVGGHHTTVETAVPIRIVPLQHLGDRTSSLRKGGFLAHRSCQGAKMRQKSKSTPVSSEGVVREPTGNSEAPCGGREDPHCARWPSRRNLDRRALAYLLLGLLKHLVPLRSLAKWTWCEKAGPRDRPAERRFTANAVRVSKLLRIANRDCLQRSLLLYRLLSAVGADPELVVGLREQDGNIHWSRVGARRRREHS